MTLSTSGCLLVLLACSTASAEYISDLHTSSADGSRARGIKKEQFWDGVTQATKGLHVPEHMELCEVTDAVIRELPEENAVVRSMLREAVDLLRRANVQLDKQATQAAEVAQEKQAEPSAGGASFWSWRGGLSFSNFWQHAAQQFQMEGQYTHMVKQDIAARKADALPILRGSADGLGSVLKDCRKVSQLGFDILKYDLYHKNVPKTPKDATGLAEKFIDAARVTRREFMSLTMAPVHSLVQDTQKMNEHPAAAVVQAELEDIGSKRFGHATEQLIDV